MTALLGTLPFIGTLWLLVVLGAAILEESGAKIFAALKGEFGQEPTRRAYASRTRINTPSARRASAPLRAAA